MISLGQLKLQLMTTGFRPDASALAAIETAQGKVRSDWVSLALSEDFFASARIQKDSGGAPILEGKSDKLFLNCSGESFEILLPGLPEVLKESQGEGEAPGTPARLDGYCLDLPLHISGKAEELKSQEKDLMACMRGVFQESFAELVQLDLDYCKQPDRGLKSVLPLVATIKRTFRTFISVRGFAPEDLKTLDHLYAAGVDVLNLPLENRSADPDLKAMAPHTRKALEYAAGVFPHGAIHTELALPAKPEEPLAPQIELLTKKGILPLLRLPEEGSETDHFPVVAEAAKTLADTAQQQGLPLKWLYPATQTLSALDARFYTHPKEEARLAVRPIYKSTLGKTAAEGFAALRRALRVQNISDSYESAGL